MEKSIIDGVLKNQIDQQGKKQVIKRYSIMLGELTKTAYELEDKMRASVLTDISNVLECIIDGIKKQ
ncbi:MAG: hypothetical protein ACK5N4_23475 [Parabacteroides gordonii]|uniref:hypothetical protein n=1 Tax=Parabacteroides TaxID=375288 RepID=UPI001CCE4EF4|nr:hypothetical protein [Parabacteroides goldsteinii]UBD75679.1 hypothetical protein K6V26_04870 [Parabacteroides goldsteinii]